MLLTPYSLILQIYCFLIKSSDVQGPGFHILKTLQLPHRSPTGPGSSKLRRIHSMGIALPYISLIGNIISLTPPIATIKKEGSSLSCRIVRPPSAAEQHSRQLRSANHFLRPSLPQRAAAARCFQMV